MYREKQSSFKNGPQRVHGPKILLINARAIFFTAVLGSALLSGCASKYKSSWSCKNPEGIGCSSISHADQIARKHIILNEEKKAELGFQDKKHFSNEKSKKPKQNDSKKVLIKGHYSDFEKFKTREVEID